MPSTSPMKLVVFPGCGSPDTELYAKVYRLLATRAESYGYSDVDVSIRWPGQMRVGGGDGSALTPSAAVETAAGHLAEYERDGSPYDILARSFGAYVALKVTMSEGCSRLRRVILWGSPPFWRMWEFFVRDLAATKTIALAKGLSVDSQFFSSLEPIESLLRQTPRSVVVATGTEDTYSTPEFQDYLRGIVGDSNPRVIFRKPVEGAPHEVTEDHPPAVVGAFLAAVLGWGLPPR